jgi:hypothetical protein
MSHIFCWTQGVCSFCSLKEDNEASSAMTGGRPEPLPLLWLGEPLARQSTAQERTRRGRLPPAAEASEVTGPGASERKKRVHCPSTTPLCPAVPLVGKDQFAKGGSRGILNFNHLNLFGASCLGFLICSFPRHTYQRVLWLQSQCEPLAKLLIHPRKLPPQLPAPGKCKRH